MNNGVLNQDGYHPLTEHFVILFSQNFIAMSFTKKLNDFLGAAQAADVIDGDTQLKLQGFAARYGADSGMLSLTGIIGFFGGFVLLLGLILVMAHNWPEMSDSTKIYFYVFTLIGFHFLGVLFSKKYPKTSALFHFIGAGYVIVGIGLIAQIYNLSSKSGAAYLLWFAMITPLAILLRHKWITIMAMCCFSAWLGDNSTFYHYANNFESMSIHAVTLAVSFILLPRLVSSHNDCFRYVKIMSAASLAIFVLIAGFAYRFMSTTEFASGVFGHHSNNIISLHPVVISLLTINFLISAAAIFWNQNSEDGNFYDKQISLILLSINLLPFLLIFNNTAILISILSWIIWFSFGGLMLYRGSLLGSKSMINWGSFCVFIGIIIRFVDLVRTMKFTGSVFIMLGIALIALSFFSEKYRKQLINKISVANAN